jgi:ABC-2 type transport system ATP-binding protein
MSAADRRSRIQELLTQFGLWDRRTEVVGGWSRGMKQKLAVARALLHRPALIFLDEPTASLDPVASAALRDDLARLAAREGVTVFLTTHNLAEAERLCARVAVIREGRLLAVGPPDELNARKGTRAEIRGSGFGDDLVERLRGRSEVTGVVASDGRLVVDLHDGAEMAPLVTLLVEHGAAIEEVRKEQASLEEVFLTLMEEER